MFDFTTNTAPTQIIIPSLYNSLASSSFVYDADKESAKQWLSHDHLVQNENIHPTIANVVDSYASSQTMTLHRRQRSYALSIGIGHPSAMKNPVQPSRLTRDRPPLSIHIPNIAPLNPIRRRIFNTSRPATPPSTTTPIRRSMPSLQAVSDWSQKRAQNTRQQRAKIVAAKILALNSPKPIRIRFPPSETPRPYVRSSLSQCITVEC